MGVSGAPRSEMAEALYEGARLAMFAPSILNTQPWRWRVRAGSLELYADRGRQVGSIDPQCRLLTLSCGGGLHHACVALRAHGHEPSVSRIPEPADPDLLARVEVPGPHEARAGDLRLAASITRRHSDRRAIAASSRVTETGVGLLQAVAAQAGAQLRRVSDEQRPFLAMAARRAQEMEAVEEPIQRDLIAWTDERTRGEGVPFDTLVATIPRVVPLRDFAGGGETGLHPGFGDDTFADFLVLATPGDTRMDWLRAGEAMSAVWLTATANGIAASVLSDVIEVPGARSLVTSLLPSPAYPQLVFRIGLAGQPTPPPASPRRPPTAVITVEDGP